MNNLKVEVNTESFNSSKIQIDDKINSNFSKGTQKRFFINVIVNLLAFLFNTVANFWYTPFLIKELGIIAYGFIPLSYSLANYTTLFTSSLSGAIGRFFTIEIAKKEYHKANITFNSSLFGLTLVSITTLCLIFPFLDAIHRIFQVPDELKYHFNILFSGTILSFLFATLGSCFSLAAYARERLDINGTIEILRHFIRMGTVVVAFHLCKATIGYVGIATMISSIFAVILCYLVWKRLTPQITISIKNFRFQKLKEILNTSFWVVIGQTGSLLFLNIDIIIVNTQCGPEEAGKYGPLLIFSTMLRSISATITRAFTPPILNKYAQGDMQKLISLSVSAVKLKGIIFSFPIAILCGFSDQILYLWLGKEFTHYGILLVLMTLHLSVNLAIIPLFSISQAFNAVKWPGIITLLSGICNVFLALYLTNIDSLGTKGTALAGAIILSLKNLVFTPLYTSSLLKTSKMFFIKPLLPGVITTSIMIFLISIIKHFFKHWNLQLITIATLIIIPFYFAIVLILLTSEEKRFIFKSIPILKNHVK